VPERNPRGTYLRVADKLRAALADGLTQLPSEAQLMEEHNVARTTVRRALRSLADEGLIASQPGVGWRVNDRQQNPQLSLRERLLERLATGGYEVGDRFLSESEICTEFVTTRAMARKALVELVGAGLLTVVLGKGRIVAALPDGRAEP
jgi:DNA-binding GntR family transcriptional regulator